MRFVALILDDHQETVTLIKSELMSKGIEVIVANSPEEATKALEAHLPHFLIVDITLQGEMDGLRWLQQIKAGPFSAIPAAIITGSSKMHNVLRAVSLGIEDYLLKYSELPVLLAKIRQIVKKIRLRNPYSVHLDGELDMPARVRAQAKVIGISETGLCTESEFISAGPYEGINYRTELFDAIGVKPPALHLINSGITQMGSDRVAFRNYFQMRGWNETELRELRKWIRKNRFETLRSA
ncbi:MAG: response regulator [Parcubacteria group bacterium]|nr:response regulator [Parcubacteria group bacterium]